MLKIKPFKAYLLIAAIVFCFSLNGVSADPCPDCPPNIPTIPGTVQHSADWLLEWDPGNPDQIMTAPLFELHRNGRVGVIKI